MGVGLYTAAVLADSPRAYWKCGEGAGGTLADSSGNGLTLTLVNAPDLSTAGPMAGQTCLKLVGASTQYGSTPSNAALDLADSWSVEYFLKPAAFAVVQYIICKGAGAYADLYNAANRFQMQRRAILDLDQSGSAYANPGLWYHVVQTKNGATMNTYVNGISDNSPVANSACVDNASPLFIGVQDALIAYLTASLSNIAIYSGALSGARALAHYNASLAADPAGGGMMMKGVG